MKKKLTKLFIRYVLLTKQTMYNYTYVMKITYLKNHAFIMFIVFLKNYKINILYNPIISITYIVRAFSIILN